MTSSRAKGTYYLLRTRKYFEALGWKTEKLEVAIPFFIKGRAIFSRRDIFGADLGIWKGDEFFLVQVKYGEARSVSTMRAEAIRQFAECDVPLKRIIVIWQPKAKPIIEEIKS